MEEHHTCRGCSFYFSVPPCRSSENSTSDRKWPSSDMSGETEKRLMEFWILDESSEIFPPIGTQVTEPPKPVSVCLVRQQIIDNM